MATKNINIRISDTLHALVKTSAEEDYRSLNSQIIWLLEAGLQRRGTPTTLDVDTHEVAR